MYKLSDIEIVSYGGQEIYLEISTDGPTNLEPYFASVYTKSNKAKSVIKDIKALGLKAVYPVEYTNDNLLTKILINFLAIIFISEVSVYLIGIFFIVYVILGRVYRSRVKDYSILRTLGITKKDMAKVVNVEMLLIGYGITIFTYLFFNGLVYAVDALTFLRSMGISAFIMYFLVMFIFVSAMSKRFNKRIFRFTVRESVRGDDDND
jgi:ABC-type antimicrobial peptide transport system permease subunit